MPIWKDINDYWDPSVNFENTFLIKSICVVSLEAPDSDKLEISGTDDQLLLCYIFQVCMFFIEKGLHKKITVSVEDLHVGLIVNQLVCILLFLI